MKFNAFKLFTCTLLSTLAAVVAPVGECLAKVPLVHFGKNTVKLEVADTNEKIQRGLMFRRSLPEQNGMVFLFRPPRPVRFWMFNCFIPLDMVFIENGKIVKIARDVPFCKETDPKKCPLYPADGEIGVTEVVELAAGYCKRHSINEGDTVKFEFVSQANAPASGDAQ